VSLTGQQLRAIELLRSGKKQIEVSQQIGVTAKTLQRWAKIPEYQKVLNGELHVEPLPILEPAKIESSFSYNPYEVGGREQMRRAEWDLLNSIQNAIFGSAETGDLRAIALVLKISENRRKLLGLDVQPLPAVKAVEALASDGLATETQSSAISSVFSQAEKAIKNAGNDTSVRDFGRQLEELSEEELIRLYRAELG